MESIAESVFNKFYPVFTEDKETQAAILFNFLPEFFKEVAGEWGYNISLQPAESKEKIEGSSPLFSVQTDQYGLVVIADNGNVYAVKKTSHLTNTVTWNGDDEYFNNVKTTYQNARIIFLAENISELTETTVLTAEKMENIASELVSFLCQ